MHYRVSCVLSRLVREMVQHRGNLDVIARDLQTVFLSGSGPAGSDAAAGPTETIDARMCGLIQKLQFRQEGLDRSLNANELLKHFQSELVSVDCVLQSNDVNTIVNASLEVRISPEDWNRNATAAYQNARRAVSQIVAPLVHSAEKLFVSWRRLTQEDATKKFILELQNHISNGDKVPKCLHRSTA